MAKINEKNQVYALMNNPYLNAWVDLCDGRRFVVDQIGNNVPIIIRAFSDLEFAPEIIFKGEKEKDGTLKLNFNNRELAGLPINFSNFREFVTQCTLAYDLANTLRTLEYDKLPSIEEIEQHFERERQKLQAQADASALSRGEKAKRVKFPNPFAF